MDGWMMTFIHLLLDLVLLVQVTPASAALDAFFPFLYIIDYMTKATIMFIHSNPSLYVLTPLWLILFKGSPRSSCDEECRIIIPILFGFFVKTQSLLRRKLDTSTFPLQVQPGKETYSPPTLTGAGHQRTVSTNTGWN